MTQLVNLHNITLRSAYQLHVLVFHICLYKFLFSANRSHFLGELRFQNDALYESLGYENLRLIDIVIFEVKHPGMREPP